ncbi:MAG: endopeptidase La, partial [Bacteroidales bacterium]|nr:endopeptidase La [Bacteroidales bacterium]
MEQHPSDEKHETNLVLVSEIYPDNIVVLPIQNRPLFPGIAVPLNYVGKEMVQAVKSVLERNDRFLGVSFVRQINEEEFYRSEVYHTGTLVRVLKVLEQDDEHINFVAQGVIRFTMTRRIGKEEELRWNVHYHYEEKKLLTDELKAYSMAIINSVKDLMKLNPMFLEQLKMSLNQIGMEKPGLMMDVIASMLSADPHRLQDLLETIDLYARAEKLLLILKEEIQLYQLQEKIQKQINERISKQQKEFFLREELKVIKKELGLEKDEKTAEIERIERRIKKLKLSDEAREVVEEELSKLKMLDPNSPEYHVSRTYLTWITDLPWGIFSKGNLDIKKARYILDRDHYGLADVKQRILEF